MCNPEEGPIVKKNCEIQGGSQEINGMMVG